GFHLFGQAFSFTKLEFRARSEEVSLLSIKALAIISLNDKAHVQSLVIKLFQTIISLVSR
ncbi:8035_t:CDS:1, partial [Gigaspora rosea]